MLRILLVSVFSSVLAAGTDAINVGLRVNLEYSDMNHHCKLSALVEPYRLAVEMREGELLRAQIKRSSRFKPEVRIELDDEELAGMEARSESDLFWLKKLWVSPRLLEQLIFSGEGFGSDSCFPPDGMRDISPHSFQLDFGVESVGYLLPHLIHSDEVVIRGRTNQSEPFTIRLSLTQDRR